MINWDKAFKDALNVYPAGTPPSLCISNTNPNPNATGSRNIFRDDERQIMAAAERAGFVMLGTRKDKSVSFVKR